MKTDMAYLSMGIITGFLSSEEHRNTIINAINNKEFQRAYVVILRDYLDEILSATEDEA